MSLTNQQRLLLIANHPQLIYLIQRYAEQSGCHVTCVTSVELAIDEIKQSSPAIVMLHLKAWPHDDWHLLRRLKGLRSDTFFPIVVISAMADEARARAEGADHWLWQPVMYADFQEILVTRGVIPASIGHTPGQ